MKRGQITPRLLAIIISWAALLITLAVMFILQTLAAGDSDPLKPAVNSPNNEVVLATFLRQSVDLGGDKVPLAELIAFSVMRKDDTLVKQHAEAFLNLLPNADQHRIRIVLPDETAWSYGDTHIVLRSVATATLPLPDARFVTVHYDLATAQEIAAHSQPRGRYR